MSKQNGLELKQVDEKLIGGFQRLSSDKLAKIKGGEEVQTNRICNNSGACPSVNSQECKNQYGCAEAVNKTVCTKF